MLVVALTIGLAGCSSEAARLNDVGYTRSNPDVTGFQPSQDVQVESRPLPPRPVQQGSAPTTPPGASTAVSGTGLPSGKSASPGNSAVHVIKRGDSLNKIVTAITSG